MQNRLFGLILLFTTLNGQESQSSLTAWKAIAQTPEIVEYFSGMFDKLGIQVEETGEAFTIHHQGNKMNLYNGIDPDIDFLVPLKKQNIDNMISHSKDGKINPEESWRILDVLFTPLTKVTLETPILSGNIRRKIAGVEDLTHVYLLNPTGGEASRHTLIYVKGQWLVIKGIHGKPRRTYRMTPEESILYQQKIFSAIKKNSFWSWWMFSRWYKNWRKAVSVTHKW